MSAYNRPEPNTDRRSQPREGSSGRRSGDLVAFHDTYCQAPECKAYREARADAEAIHIVHERPATGLCEWFARCGNPAVGTVEHPILGSVPVCARCTRWLDCLDPDRYTLTEYVDDEEVTI